MIPDDLTIVRDCDTLLVFKGGDLIDTLDQDLIKSWNIQPIT